jgi:DNA-directed RNA polymerase specialized sigma24 family protein
MTAQDPNAPVGATDPHDDASARVSPAAARHEPSPEALREFVALPDTQRHIRRVVSARLRSGAASDLVDDLAQEASAAALAAGSLPRAMSTAAGWVATIAARTVANHFRARAADRHWLNLAADPEEQPAPPDESIEDRWLISRWLAHAVEPHPRDQETYELVVYKARTGKTHEQVAADHGLTPSALRNRFYELKRKYKSRWERRRNVFLFAILAGGVALTFVIATILGWVLRPAAPRIAPDRADPPPRVSVSAPPSPSDAPDAPFEPAQSATPRPRGDLKP